MANPQTTTMTKIILSSAGAVIGFFIGGVASVFITWIVGGVIAIIFTPSNPEYILGIAFEWIPKVSAGLGVIIGIVAPWVEE